MTKYSVCAFEGDFPLPNQPNWDDEYESLFHAIKEAIRRYEWLRRTFPETYLTDGPYCVTVEIGDGTNDWPEFVIGRPSSELFPS